MGTLTECPDCGKHFAGRRCACGFERLSGAAGEAWERPAWMDQPKPCSAEENYRAAQNVTAVLEGQLTVEQARRVLHAIFKGREKELT